MGLDIYKLKVCKPEQKDTVHPHRLHTLSVSDNDLRENKSLSDVFTKFSEFVVKENAEYYNVQSTSLKHGIPENWYCSGISMIGDRDVMIFSDEENIQHREILLEEVDTVIDNCYHLYALEVGYQRRDCTGPMFEEFFGGGEEFFGIHYTPYNEVLDVAKTYANPNTPLKSWVLEDDEFINFSF